MPTKAQLEVQIKELIADKKSLSSKLNKKQSEFNTLNKSYNSLVDTHNTSKSLVSSLRGKIEKCDEHNIALDKKLALSKDETSDLQRAVQSFADRSWLGRALMTSGDIKNWIDLEVDGQN